MHFVAGDTGELAASETGRRLQTVELAPGHANHAVAPKTIVEKVRLGSADEILLFLVVALVRLDNEALAKVDMSGPKDRALTIKIDLVGHVIEGPDAVALRAIQTRGCGGEARGVGYSRVASRGQMCRETAKRIAISSNVLASFTMARFTGDPELRDAGVPFVAGNEPGLPLRDVTIHAGAIPGAYRIVFLRVGRHQKRLRHRRPNFFRNDVGKGKLFQRAVFASFEPENLQIVRAGKQYDFARRPIFAAHRTSAHENLLPVALQLVIALVQRKLGHVFDTEDVRGSCHLRHRSMIGSMPTRVVIKMTRAASVRSLVISNARLNRPILWRMHFATEMMIGTKRQRRPRDNDHDSEQPLPKKSTLIRHDSVPSFVRDHRKGPDTGKAESLLECGDMSPLLKAPTCRRTPNRRVRCRASTPLATRQRHGNRCSCPTIAAHRLHAEAHWSRGDSNP